ncbi:hypothetical protein SEA_TYSON_66 [Mycobacterium phage Tyson]|nr:hypothetical protein SEA_TYSON_66 [Mycobacterium phage Tyson]
MRLSEASCELTGCRMRRHARGLCAVHYAEHRRAGTLPALKSPKQVRVRSNERLIDYLVTYHRHELYEALER